MIRCSEGTFTRYFAPALVGVLAILCALPVWSATHVLILRGLGGEARQEERFQDWTARLESALVEKCGVPGENVMVAPRPDESDAGKPLTAEQVRALFAEIAPRVAREDAFLLILVGHGSQQREAKFMLQGPDITAEAFGSLLESIPSVRQVVVNATSSSAAFINALSAPGRIICTSTRSGVERNAPEFMEHFVRVLEEGRGDTNRDGEVTLAELCDAAATATQAWYDSEGYVATEHALLDDNGDGRGTRLPLAENPERADGDFASALVVQPDAAMAAADPELVGRYRAAIASVKALTADKSSYEEDEYWTRLEALLLDAARLNRAIVEGEMPSTP